MLEHRLESDLMSNGPTEIPKTGMAAWEHVRPVLWLGLTFLLFWVMSLQGGPLYWDDLFYLHTAQNLGPNATLLNRFVHIYLLRLAMAVTGDPFAGAQLLWAVDLTIIYTCSVAVTWRLAGARSWLGGLVAVIVLSVPHTLLGMPGESFSDFTATALVTATAWAVLGIPASCSNLARFALAGALAFCSLKSRETGVLALIFIALALYQQWRWGKMRTALRMAGAAMAGFAAGQLALCAADAALLGDPLFSIRPTSWRTVVDFNIRPEWKRASDNWFANIFHQGELSYAFLLTLVSLHFCDRRDCRESSRLLVAAAAAYLGVLTILQTSAAWLRLVDRYLIPLIPVLAWSAGVYLHQEAALARDRDGRFILAGVLAAIVMIALLPVLAWPALVQLGWTAPHAVSSLLVPLMLVLALFGAVLPWPGVRAGVLLCGLLISSAFPMAGNLATIVSANYKETVEQRFLPFASVRDHITPVPPGSIFVSEGVRGRNKRLLCRDSPSCQWMYNLYFGTQLPAHRFSYGPLATARLFEDGIGYAWVARKELTGQKPRDKVLLKRHFEIIDAEPAGILFLKRRPDASVKDQLSSGILPDEQAFHRTVMSSR